MKRKRINVSIKIVSSLECMLSCHWIFNCPTSAVQPLNHEVHTGSNLKTALETVDDELQGICSKNMSWNPNQE